jgi:hypothetical protein
MLPICEQANCGATVKIYCRSGKKCAARTIEKWKRAIERVLLLRARSLCRRHAQRGKEWIRTEPTQYKTRKEGAREWALGLQKHTLHNNCAKLEKFLWGLTTLWAADQKITIYYSLACAISAFGRRLQLMCYELRVFYIIFKHIKTNSHQLQNEAQISQSWLKYFSLILNIKQIY